MVTQSNTGYPLISQCSMARHLFTVSYSLAIRNRGVVILPGIIPVGDERFRVGDPLLLKRPDGSEIKTTISGLELFTCVTNRDIPVLLNGIGKEEVPIGTEVWSVDGALAG